MFGASYQQSWKNEKISKQWETVPVEETASTTQAPVAQNSGLGTLIGSKLSEAEPVQSQAKSVLVQAAPVFFQPQPVPVQPVVLPSGPYVIQQQTITQTGETIIENLIGGIPFDCTIRPTGHWRDSKYCDIFHACVFGSQRKTYSCAFVGEHTYFDDVTKRCEFVRSNPAACATSIFYH